MDDKETTQKPKKYKKTDYIEDIIKDLPDDKKKLFHELGGFLKNDWIEEAIIDEAKEINPKFGWKMKEACIRKNSNWEISAKMLRVRYNRLDNAEIKKIEGFLKERFPDIGYFREHQSFKGDTDSVWGLYLDPIIAMDIVKKRLPGYIERDQAAKEARAAAKAAKAKVEAAAPKKNSGASKNNPPAPEKSCWEKMSFWCCGDVKNSGEISSLTRDHPMSHYQR